MKVYVGNLPFSINDNSLADLFSSYGEIEEAKVIIDKFSNRSKGFGFVTFKDDESAKKAIEALNEKEVEGRALKVNEAKPMDPDRPRAPRRDFNRRDSGRDSGRRSFGGRDSGSSGGSRRRF
jgi:RNA recognition motif-containing protein